MNLPCPTTIAEVIWYALVIIVGAAFVELRWTIRKMITKIDELPEKYVAWKVLNERIIDPLSKDRKDKWTAQDEKNRDFDRHIAKG